MIAHTLITGTTDRGNIMDTSKELNYRLYTQREEGFIRSPMQSEFSRYDAIKNGDLDAVRSNINEIKKNYYEGKGRLSDSLLRNNIYHFVVAVGVTARVCIDAGMPHNESYTLSDIYIRRADVLTDPEEVVRLLFEMQLDYAARMHKLHRMRKGSIHVKRAIDYIYDHLDEPLTMEDLAYSVHLNPSYFSRLFADEMGETVKKYINRIKIETAKQMWEMTDHSSADISVSLGFSSPAAFSSVFKKYTGQTPGAYRKTLLHGAL